MEYSIRESETGQFEIVRSVPQVVATFVDQVLAIKVMSFLVEDELGESTKDKIRKSQSVLKSEVDKKPIKTEISLPAPAHQAAISEAEPVKEPQELTPMNLSAAIVRLQDGETLRGVADDMGLDWKQLRSKWALHNRVTQKKPQSSASAPDAVCKLCNKSFKASIENMETCARCSR